MCISHSAERIAQIKTLHYKRASKIRFPSNCGFSGHYFLFACFPQHIQLEVQSCRRGVTFRSTSSSSQIDFLMMRSWQLRGPDLRHVTEEMTLQCFSRRASEPLSLFLLSTSLSPLLVELLLHSFLECCSRSEMLFSESLRVPASLAPVCVPEFAPACTPRSGLIGVRITVFGTTARGHFLSSLP